MGNTNNKVTSLREDNIITKINSYPYEELESYLSQITTDEFKALLPLIQLTPDELIRCLRNHHSKLAYTLRSHPSNIYDQLFDIYLSIMFG